jgi:hypothetical protein
LSYPRLFFSAFLLGFLIVQPSSSLVFYYSPLQLLCFTLRVSHTVKHAILASFSFSWTAVPYATQERASNSPSHRHSPSNNPYNSYYRRDFYFKFYTLVYSLGTGRLSICHPYQATVAQEYEKVVSHAAVCPVVQQFFSIYASF